jgi:rfaE bifunctional protein nucleotidyltransferase chain/domain
VDRIAALHRHGNTPICLTTGCFDVLHIGHLRLLEHAATYGVLFVGINTDRSIKELKGDSRPINTLDHRAAMLSALRFVNAVFPIDDLRVDKAIRLINPDFWLKGGDYTLDNLDKDEVKAANDVGAQIVLFRSPHSISTTSILSRL